jgi:hypothetical protein
MGVVPANFGSMTLPWSDVIRNHNRIRAVRHLVKVCRATVW